MHHHSLRFGIFALVCGLLADAAPAWAQANQTWVSGNGRDTSTTCPITAPCRTFQYAHDRTNPGGIINVLSPGNFGPVNIFRPISIVADGVEALISAINGGNGIFINTPGITVFLRGLTIDLLGDNANDGILFSSGAALHVHNCVIRRARNGILFAPAFGGKLYVTDSVIANPIDGGIVIAPSATANAEVVFDRVRVENVQNGSGIVFPANTAGPAKVTIRDSVSAGHSVGAGLALVAASGGSINVTVDRAAFLNNTTGIQVQGAGATVRIGDSTVTGNTTGLAANSGGTIASYGTNKVSGNTTDGDFTGTVAYR